MAGKKQADEKLEVEPHGHIGGPDDDCADCGLSRLNRVHSGIRPRLRAV